MESKNVNLVWETPIITVEKIGNTLSGATITHSETVFHCPS